VVRVHVLQLSYGDPEEPQQRVDRVEELLEQQAGADLVVLPELWFNGGFSYDRWRTSAEPLDGPLVGRMREIARRLGATLHMGSFVELAGARPDGSPLLYNTSVLIGHDGNILGTYRKVHRFGFSEGEPQLMEPGEGLTVVATCLAGQEVTVGLATCYDLRFPELFRGLVDLGADVAITPAAWPMSRIDHWSALGVARAIEDQFFMVQCNTAGTHAGIEMGGRSMVTDPSGRVLGSAGVDQEVLIVEIDGSAVGAARQNFPVLADRRLP
jgi:predicted amidohydrolase